MIHDDLLCFCQWVFLIPVSFVYPRWFFFLWIRFMYIIILEARLCCLIEKFRQNIKKIFMNEFSNKGWSNPTFVLYPKKLNLTVISLVFTRIPFQLIVHPSLAFLLKLLCNFPLLYTLFPGIHIWQNSRKEWNVKNKL